MMFTRNHTVDKAIAPLLKAQSDLEAVTTERSALIDKNHDKIVELQADNVTADAERMRANRIAAALKKITDPEDIPQAIPARYEPSDGE
jgi:hypothetical protein